MNMKQILCLILAAVLLFGLVAGSISLLVMNASAADLTTQPSTDPSAPTAPSGEQGNQQELKNGDKIVIFILGAIVPCIIFLVMIVRVAWRGK